MSRICSECGKTTTDDGVCIACGANPDESADAAVNMESTPRGEHTAMFSINGEPITGVKEAWVDRYSDTDLLGVTLYAHIPAREAIDELAIDDTVALFSTSRGSPGGERVTLQAPELVESDYDGGVIGEYVFADANGAAIQAHYWSGPAVSLSSDDLEAIDEELEEAGIDPTSSLP